MNKNYAVFALDLIKNKIEQVTIVLCRTEADQICELYNAAARIEFPDIDDEPFIVRPVA